jgi:hypothetical protein
MQVLLSSAAHAKKSLCWFGIARRQQSLSAVKNPSAQFRWTVQVTQHKNPNPWISFMVARRNFSNNFHHTESFVEETKSTENLVEAKKVTLAEESNPNTTAGSASTFASLEVIPLQQPKTRTRKFANKNNVMTQKPNKQLQREQRLFSKLCRSLQWFHHYYGHLHIPKQYVLPHSREDVKQNDDDAQQDGKDFELDEDIRGYKLGNMINSILNGTSWTREPYVSRLIEIGVLPQLSTVSFDKEPFLN